MTGTPPAGRPVAGAAALVAVVLLAACAAAAPDPVPSPAPSTPAPRATGSASGLRLVVLGDSLGVDFGGPVGSYATAFAADVRDATGSPVTIDNRAGIGVSSGSLLRLLSTDDDLRRTVGEADVVTWSVGGNDLARARLALALGVCGGDDGQACVGDAVAGFVDNWDRIVAELDALTTGRTLLATMTIYNPYVGEDVRAGVAGQVRDALARVNAHILSATPGAVVADVHRSFNGPAGTRDPVAAGLIASDGLHPSAQGRERIADVLAEAALARLDHDP